MSQAAELSRNTLAQVVPSGGSEWIDQRSIMASDQEDSSTQPRLHRYIAFHQRMIDAIPVRGHGAVVSHYPDGTLFDLRIRWGGKLASSDRQYLSTPYTPEQIRTRFLDQLQFMGLTEDELLDHHVELNYVMVPQQNSDDTTSMILAVEGIIKQNVSDFEKYGSKTRVVMMELDPRAPLLPLSGAERRGYQKDG